MDTQNPSAPPRAQSRNAGENHPHRHPHSDVVHDNTRHTTRFTMIGNHLARHPELSGLAIGLGVHIQSLPTGARVDIETRADRTVSCNQPPDTTQRAPSEDGEDVTIAKRTISTADLPRCPDKDGGQDGGQDAGQRS